MIKILDICSGIGGFSLGLEATGGFDTVAFCEFDDFCCKVLNKHWPNVPIYKDLKEIGNDPERIIQEFDLICGGIPCQPFSLAGKQKGKEDDRHLWPYMYEIVKSKKPTWVIVENVGGFVNVALDDVCLDLEAQGYATQSFIIPACSVEAPHKRDRIWILGKRFYDVGDTEHDGLASSEEQGRMLNESEEQGGPEQIRKLERASGTQEHVANTQSNREDGVLRTTEPKHDQGDTRMESSSCSDRRSERGTSQDVANSKELEDHEHDNGERTQQDREHRVSQQPGGEGSLGGGTNEQGKSQPQLGGMADGVSPRLDGHLGFEREPNIPRVATGIPNRVNRLKTLGNSIVPQIVYNIGLAILEEEERTNVAK